ncbi:energy transducer TonB [Methylobacterium sp. E-005]|uniref:energy transducer TonB n=1 Tax=Methylobacterium sp. E-005 TaxID=2836549 RepID=UPI001FBA445D|nr:energy transducer TonB [Methylobacterium sp. E-005]MCJ2085257.1 energy transducer TonB [Methylobacterium sp. E-005]
MSSVDPTPRLFAAAAALTGTGILMCRTEPSWDGILLGLLCLGLWALGTLAARPSRPARPARPLMLEAVVVETPRAPPELLPAPRPAAGRAAVPLLATRPPEVPTHRQRVAERHTRRRR